jgi:PAT family beta-lactamase induction signal transducer AmpG
VALQLGIGGALASVALTLPGPAYFQASLAVFWLLAFSSATHDIAADGFYLLAMPPHRQAAFVGVRSTFYRMATLSGQGGLVYLAGYLAQELGSFTKAWSAVFLILAVFFVLAGLYHYFALPKPETDRPAPRTGRILADFAGVFVLFFKKPGIGAALGFLLLYRFAESQALKLVTPFLLDGRDIGGLGLTTQQVGLVYGTVGVASLTIGGILGGWIISIYGLKRMLWPMILAMNTPNLVFVYLSLAQPDNIWLISSLLAVEQLGYGFGFAAYMLYMIMLARGENQTAHYAICTGFMALGMMLPGMAAGWIQDQLGYVNFFIWVLIATIPSFGATALIKIEPGFGKKSG